MQKGVKALINGGWDAGYRYGTLLLFGGMVLTGILDLLVHFLSDFAGENEDIDATKVPEVVGSSSSDAADSRDTSIRKSTDVVADMEAGKVSADAHSNSSPVAVAFVGHVRSLSRCVPLQTWGVHMGTYLHTMLLFTCM
jgi:hypothetical protein